MGLEIKGLTSAASLWATTGIGLAISVGGAFLIIAVSVTVIALFTLAVLAKVEKRLLPNSHPCDLFISCQNREAFTSLCEDLLDKGIRVLSIKVVRSEPNAEALVNIHGDHDKALRLCLKKHGVLEARWVED
jgi:putative Mg2+ transporter-C (MgtC) family protein